MRFLYSLYGIWNLDFFVAIIPSFGLPHQNVFSVITLTYVIAFYPLVLLVVLSESYCGYGGHFIRATFDLGDTVTSEDLLLMLLQLFFYFCT